MSERDLHRIGVLPEVVSRRRSVASAASLLAVSSRHFHRLLPRLEVGGGAALARQARGRPHGFLGGIGRLAAVSGALAGIGAFLSARLAIAGSM